MPNAWRRLLLAVLVTSSLTAAQEPAASQDNTIQALLKEVHALRIALEHSNQVGPKIQIALARMQLQEERVRNATRQLSEARDRVVDIQNKRAEAADRIKQFETQPPQTADPNARRQMEFELTEMKAQMERLGTLEGQFHAKEADASSLLSSEQVKWNEVNDLLMSMERMLAPPQLR